MHIGGYRYEKFAFVAATVIDVKPNDLNESDFRIPIVNKECGGKSKVLVKFNGYSAEHNKWLPCNKDWITEAPRESIVFPLFPPTNKLFLILKTLNLSHVFGLDREISVFILHLIFQFGV